MADPNEFGEHEMMGSFVEDGHEYESGLGSEFSEDIKATAHFTQAQINNINHQNYFADNSEASPVGRFQSPQMNGSAVQQIHDYSLQDSGGVNPQLLHSSGSIKQNTAGQNYKKAHSAASSEGHNPDLNQQQLSNYGSPAQGQTFIKKGSLKSNEQKQARQNFGNREFQMSQKSKQSQFSQSQQVVIKQGQEEYGVNQINTAGQLSTEYHGNQRNPQPTLYHSEPIESRQERVQQIGRMPSAGDQINDNRPLNIQQAVFSQVMSSQPTSSNQRSSHNLQNQQTSKVVQNSPTAVKGQAKQIAVVGLNSPSGSTPSYLNRYFPAGPQVQTQAIQPSQLLLNSSPVNTSTTKTVTQSNSVPQIINQNRAPPQVRQSELATSLNQNANKSAYLNQQGRRQMVSPTSPYQQLKPQSPPINLYNQQSQPSPRASRNPEVRPSSTIVVETGSPPSSRSPSPSFPIQQVGGAQGVGRQSRILGNEQSGVVYGSRRSISYGSAESKGKPAVYFTYSSNTGSKAPIQKEVQVVQKNTVIQKTTVVVWEHRYLTVLQRFHFISHRFDTLVKEIRLVTQLLEQARGDNLNNLYRDLLARHTALLEMLEETQREITEFQQQSNSYNKQIQYESEVREQKLYKEKFHYLEYENTKLKEEIFRLTEQIKSSNKSQPQLQSQLQSQPQPQLQPQLQPQQSELKHMEAKIIKMQEELARSQAFTNELQQYIGNLENEYNSISSEVERLRGGEKTTIEYVNLIKNQEIIIRELEEELGKRNAELQHLANRKQVPQSQEDIEDYIRAINQLEAKVREMEQSAGRSQTQEKEAKYTEIIENQRSIIENIDHHFKQFEKGASAREEELVSILRNQESIIRTLEDQLRNGRTDPSPLSNHREQSLLKEIEEARTKIKQLQAEVQRLQQKNNATRYELEARVTEVTSLREERLTYQRSVQQKLEQKLIMIEQQLRSRSSEVQKLQPSPSSPKLENRQQVQELMEQNDRLVSQIRKKQLQKRKLEDEMIAQDENMRRKLMEKESEIRLLNDKIKLLDEENRRRFSDKDRKIKVLEDEIEALTNKVRSNVSTPRNNQNNQNFENFSPSPSNNQQVRSLKDRLSQREQELMEIQRQKENVEKKFQALQVSFNGVDEENVKKTQQLMNLKRQLSSFGTFDSEIKTLTETVAKKNQEILELKSVSFEKNELKIELESTKNERNILKATIQSKAQEIDKLKQTISEFEAKVRESKNRQSLFPTNSSESAVEELQIMYQSMKKKEVELIKIKQANQLLETNVQELEYELERAKAKIATLEKNHSHDKEDHLSTVAEYEKVIKQLEAKTKSLDESQRMNKTNYNVELQNMDNVLKEKEEAVRKLEGENKVLKNKLKNHDSKTQEYESEIQNLNKKVRQIEAARDELKKQIEAAQSGNQNNNKKLYDEYQIKIVELEASIKVKDNKIKQLENNFETLKLKSAGNNQAEEDFINQQQIEVLRKKVAEYESRLFNFNGSRINNFKSRDYESTHVFEQRAIYELKAENQRLKSLMSSKSMRYPSAQVSPQKVNVDFIQKRLVDFNQKLEEMIEENRSLEQKNVDFAALLEPRHQTQHFLISFQRDRASLMKKHRAEISALQARMVDLQRYCSSLEVLPNNTSTYSYTSNSKYVDSAKGVYAEQLNYYKEKNKELEERIDEHIKINKELKEKLEGALRSGGDVNAIEFYRLQVSQMEKQSSEYLMKIKSLTEENSRLRFSLESHKNDQSSELKITELETRIHQLNRKIAQLQMQNGILESDVQKYVLELKNSNDESQKHKAYTQEKDQKLNLTEQGLREANSKISNYELQFVKLTNQIKLLESEVERLNEKSKGKQAEESGEISRLKARLLQLQTEIRQYEEHANTWNEAKVSYEQTISTLNARIANLEAEVSRLNALYGNLSKKAKDSDGEFFELENKLKAERTRANELQSLLQVKQTQIDSMNQFLERIKRERDNEGTQSKQRLSYISEMEEAIRGFKLEVSQYKSELERLRSENNEARQRISSMTNLEEITKQLRLEVQLHKGQIERLKSANDQLKQRLAANSQWEQTAEQLGIQVTKYKIELERLRREMDIENEQKAYAKSYAHELEENIRKLKIETQATKSENLRFTAEIERLRKENQRMETELSRLRIYIEKMQKQIRERQEHIAMLAYQLEFIRSTFIQIEALSEELEADKANTRQVEILDKLNASVTGGLKKCHEVSSIL